MACKLLGVSKTKHLWGWRRSVLCRLGILVGIVARAGGGTRRSRQAWLHTQHLPLQLLFMACQGRLIAFLLNSSSAVILCWRRWDSENDDTARKNINIRKSCMNRCALGSHRRMNTVYELDDGVMV